MHVYFIAFGISLLCVLGSIALRRTKWQSVVWLPAILLPMVVLLDVFGVMPVSIALGPHSFTGFTIQIWFWYSAVPLGGVAIVFLVLGAIFFPRDRALNVSAFLVGIALSTGTLYGLYLRETEVISVRVISAAGQPVPNQEVIFWGLIREMEFSCRRTKPELQPYGCGRESGGAVKFSRHQAW